MTTECPRCKSDSIETFKGLTICNVCNWYSKPGRDTSIRDLTDEIRALNTENYILRRDIRQRDEVIAKLRDETGQ